MYDIILMDCSNLQFMVSRHVHVGIRHGASSNVCQTVQQAKGLASGAAAARDAGYHRLEPLMHSRESFGVGDNSGRLAIGAHETHTHVTRGS
jgi:hypothetical protein